MQNIKNLTESFVTSGGFHFFACNLYPFWVRILIVLLYSTKSGQNCSQFLLPTDCTEMQASVGKSDHRSVIEIYRLLHWVVSNVIS